MTATNVEEIIALYTGGGAQAYFGESVTQLEHALQAAHAARCAGADDELVLGALLHDIGHLLGGDFRAGLGVIDHDRMAGEWLRERGFSPRLIGLVSGHVAAKRYLVTVARGYRDRLSPTSEVTFQLQGGAMTPEEVEAFEHDPYFDDLLRLRAWDEQAKDPALQVPGIEAYRAALVAALRA